jgi:hypothetical protein
MRGKWRRRKIMDREGWRRGSGKCALRKRVYIHSITPIVPALVGYGDEFPRISSEVIAREAADLICCGPVEAFIALYGGGLLLNIMSLLTTGRRLKSLPLDQQKEFLSKAFESRSSSIRSLSFLVGIPLKAVYYGQEDVCKVLGFDRCELVEDAKKHQVARDR